MKRIRIAIATNGGGASTSYGDQAVVGAGVVYAIDYLPGTVDTGATVTITDETGTISKTVWSKASAGTSNIRVHPRVLEQKGSDGSDLTSYTFPFVSGRLKCVVSSGGASTAGNVDVWVLEM